MTLDELRRKRAQDMLALIEQLRPPVPAGRRPSARPEAAAASEGDETVGRSPCSARELEWLAPELALRETSTTRSDTAPHSAYGVASPFMPSLLVVVYTARYFLASHLRSQGASRDVHIVYGALQAVPQPYERGIGIEPR
jgi:hypothetical protein